MYLLKELSYDMPLQWYGNYIEVKKVNYMLEKDSLRNYSQNILGVYSIVQMTPRPPAG